MGAESGGQGTGAAFACQRWYGTTFTYDNRGRLIREVREGEGEVGLGTILFVYDLEYRYDQVGNRTEKIDHLSNVSTAYIYDVEDRAFYGSNSNRLMTYRITDNDTGAFEDVWYYYDVNGNVLRIVRLTDGAPQYESTGFVYNKGQMVEYVVGETWNAIEEVEWHEGGSAFEYALTPEPMTWAAAQAYAESRGGDLVWISSQMWEWLTDTFAPPPGGGTVSYWVGAYQDPQGIEPDQGWWWVTGGSADWPWLPGEPDDGGAGGCPPVCLNHDHGAYVMDDDGEELNDAMEDAEGTELRYGIIQRPTGAACDAGQDQLRNWERTFAWQFRYETARGRYMRRMLDPETLEAVVTEWSQYDGDWVHADFEISGGAAVTTRHYFGAGHADVDGSGDWTDEAIAFGNQIDSTELLTDANGQVTQDWAYTAFGEPADLGGSGDTRYRYAGYWGYETNSEWPIANGEFPFLHVGYRWYDPETGRFLQRDPIGIEGGLNAYAYLEGNPVGSVDPDGLIPIDGVDWPPEIITPEEREGRRRGTAMCLAVMFDVATLAVPAGAAYRAVKVGGYAVKGYRYAKVGGRGVSVYKKGRRVLTIDVHRVPPRGHYRPHYHRRPGIGKHRPWDGGW